MIKKLILAAFASLSVVEAATAVEELDAVINDASRKFTERKNSPDALNYGRLTLDSKGQVVSMAYMEGVVTKATKVTMGAFNEKTKKWVPGEVIKEGIQAELFQEKGTEVQLRLLVANDKKTITHILVKKTDEPLVMADPEFDALLKEVGPQTNGVGGIAYVRQELNEKGAVVKTFPLKTGRVNAETKVVMGKYNAKDKKWEAGDEIAGGLYGDIFKDVRAKPVAVRITLDERKAIAQILVRPMGN